MSFICFVVFFPLELLLTRTNLPDCVVHERVYSRLYALSVCLRFFFPISQTVIIRIVLQFSLLPCARFTFISLSRGADRWPIYQRFEDGIVVPFVHLNKSYHFDDGTSVLHCEIAAFGARACTTT